MVCIEVWNYLRRRRKKERKKKKEQEAEEKITGRCNNA